MDDKNIVEDPATGNVVRFTDNGIKEGDSISESWQFDEPVELGPEGKPYFISNYPGDGEKAAVDIDLIEREDSEDDDS